MFLKTSLGTLHSMGNLARTILLGHAGQALPSARPGVELGRGCAMQPGRCFFSANPSPGSSFVLGSERAMTARLCLAQQV